jgi:hypothetical protein
MTVWSPVTGSRLRVPPDRDSAEVSGDGTLAGTRVLCQDGQSANTYTDFEVLTAGAATRQRPAVLYPYASCRRTSSPGTTQTAWRPSSR